MWDLTRGERVFWTKVRSAPATAVAWSPDGGRYLLVTDTVVSVYLASGELACSLDHPKRVAVAAFTSSVGVATAGEERVIKLWDSRSGALAATSAAHTNRIRGLAVIPGSVLSPPPPPPPPPTPTQTTTTTTGTPPSGRPPPPSSLPTATAPCGCGTRPT